jgi:hypothetical protein
VDPYQGSAEAAGVGIPLAYQPNTRITAFVPALTGARAPKSPRSQAGGRSKQFRARSARELSPSARNSGRRTIRPCWCATGSDAGMGRHRHVKQIKRYYCQESALISERTVSPGILAGPLMCWRMTRPRR